MLCKLNAKTRLVLANEWFRAHIPTTRMWGGIAIRRRERRKFGLFRWNVSLSYPKDALKFLETLQKRQVQTKPRLWVPRSTRTSSGWGVLGVIPRNPNFCNANLLYIFRSHIDHIDEVPVHVFAYGFCGWEFCGRDIRILSLRVYIIFWSDLLSLMILALM